MRWSSPPGLGEQVPLGACLSPRLPTMPFVCRFSPIPPSALAERSSRREGGESRLFHARGFAPCIPETEPGRRWLFLWKTVPQGGLVPGVAGWLCCTGAQGGVVFRLACLPCHLFTVFPPSPFPSEEGGDFLLYFAGGWRPRHPCYRSRAALVIPSGRNHLNITGSTLVNAYL